PWEQSRLGASPYVATSKAAALGMLLFKQETFSEGMTQEESRELAERMKGLSLAAVQWIDSVVTDIKAKAVKALQTPGPEGRRLKRDIVPLYRLARALKFDSSDIAFMERNGVHIVMDTLACWGSPLSLDEVEHQA